MVFMHLQRLLVVAALCASVTSAKLHQMDCDKRTCPHGACIFKNCNDHVSCTGGGCSFDNCASASCEGGACVFVACGMQTCRGGGCEMTDPAVTLMNGYCDGGGCAVNGVQWPSRLDYHLAE